MRDQEPPYPSQNIVPFPHLTSRLLEKGVAAIKEKNYSEALNFFKQLYELEPNHPQASFGLAVCFVELGAYREAEELTEKMLKNDIGNYFDVLKLHISVLIQRQQYQKVIHMIEAVIEEGAVPSHMAMSLKQLEDFSRKRLQEKPLDLDAIESVEEAMEDDHHEEVFDHQTFNQYLMGKDIERQWLAIQNATAFLDPMRIADLRDFLTSEFGDPFLKSVVTRLLKEKVPELKTLKINKYGQTFQISLKDDLHLNEEQTGQVKQLLSKIENQNPTIYEMAIQIWEHFDIARYPIPIDDLPSSAWAAGCYYYTQELNGIVPKMTQLADEFDTSVSGIQTAKDRIDQVEKASTYFSK